jgi:hypothetical protein
MRNSTVAIGDAALAHLTHNYLSYANEQPRTYLHCQSSLLLALLAPATPILNMHRCRN